MLPAHPPHDLFGQPPGGGLETHNLFFALVPAPVTREAMARAAEGLRAAHVSPGRWINPARYHLTLHFLGAYSQVPAGLVADACAAAAAVRLPAFELLLERAGSFSKGIGWLGCDGEGALHDLWTALHRALAQARVGVQGHAAFRPHVTVLRDAHRPLPSQPIAPIRWPVAGFVLIDSVLGARNEYRTLGQWALGRA